MSIEETNPLEYIMPTSPADLAKINSAVDEIVNSMVRKSAESAHIAEIKKLLKEEFDMPVKLVQRLAKTSFDRNLAQQVVADLSFHELYIKLRGKKEGIDEGDFDDEDEE